MKIQDSAAEFFTTFVFRDTGRPSPCGDGIYASDNAPGVEVTWPGAWLIWRDGEWVTENKTETIPRVT